ncbi:hypothetical protein Tco_1095786, partial [Tanacetum coccineum]
MHQPWRTLATIINKCLSGKTSSNDRLRQLRVAILQAKLRRREIMPYPRFTKIIINHFLSLNPSIPKGPSSGLSDLYQILHWLDTSEEKQRQTGSRIKSKKKVSILVEDNIIPEPDCHTPKIELQQK